MAAYGGGAAYPTISGGSSDPFGTMNLQPPKLTLNITVQLPEGDNPVDALKRADSALADVGLNITTFVANSFPSY